MKRIVLSTLGILSLAALMLSNGNGVSGIGADGCTCHGASSTNTTVELLNLPADGFEAGQSYQLQAVVSNANLGFAGFNLDASEGMFSAGALSQVVSGQATHIAKVQMNGGNAVFDFTWTAPTSPVASVDFLLTGNAVNGDNGTGGDEWAQRTITLLADTLTSVRDLAKNNYKLYPNPAQGELTIVAQNEISNVTVFDITGKEYHLDIQTAGKKAKVITEDLADGNYVLQWNEKDRVRSASFVKK